MALRQEPRVSVVTPVYNGERHIRECIESVLAQTYTNWDYTIVNNCSTDRTLEIAREYAAKDLRIRVVDNEKFARVIENHNNAIRQITSESTYCKIVAADDWIFPECLERMVGLAEAHPTVAIVGAYELCGTAVFCIGLPYPSTVVPGRELCRKTILGELYVFGAPTCLLYRSEIVRSRHAFYDEDTIHADADVCYEFLENHNFGFIHQVLTYRRLREDSVTASQSSRLNTYLPNELQVLLRFGPKYLTDDELSFMIRRRLKKYYSYLGEQAFRRREKQFWSFHSGKLAKLGYPLSKPRLAAQAILYALDFVYSKRTLFAVARWIRRAWPKLTG